MNHVHTMYNNMLACERFQIVVADVGSGSLFWPFSGIGLPHRDKRAITIATMVGRLTPGVVCVHGLHDPKSRNQFIETYQTHFSQQRIQWMDDVRTEGYDNTDTVPSSSESKFSKCTSRLSMARFILSTFVLMPLVLIWLWMETAWQSPLISSMIVLVWSIASLCLSHMLLYTPLGAMLSDKTHGLLIGYDVHKIQSVVYIRSSPFHFLTQDMEGYANSHAYHGLHFRTTHTNRNFILLSGSLSSATNVQNVSFFVECVILVFLTR